MPAIEQPGAALKAGWNLGESQWKDDMDANLRYLSAAIQPTLEVISGELPASASPLALAWDESEGATGALKYWDGTQWEISPVQPREGWSLWVKDLQKQVTYMGDGVFSEAAVLDAPSDGRSYLRKNGQWVAQDYFINAFLPAIVGSDTVQAAFIIPSDMVLPESALGSIARCNTASVNAVTFIVRKNNTQLGSITFAADETEGVFAVNEEVSFVTGDELSIVTQSSLGAVPEGVKLLLRFEM